MNIFGFYWLPYRSGARYKPLVAGKPKEPYIEGDVGTVHFALGLGRSGCYVPVQRCELVT